MQWMKKLKFLVILFSIALTVALLGWRWDIWAVPEALQVAADLEGDRPAEVIASAPLQVPAVQSQRLLADLTALEFDRFSQVGRDRARTYIRQSLTAAGWTVQEQPFTGGINLYAERLGTVDGAGSILIGAHYDSVERSPGIDDNASGVAMTLEAARLLGDRPTPHTLKVAFFDLEEVGLVGSQAFVSDPSNIRDLKGALIMEMLAYACDTPGCQRYPDGLPIPQPSNRGNFIAIIGDQGHSHLIEAFPKDSSVGVPIVTLAVPLVGALMPDLLRSDHVPFWQNGIGAVMVTDTANFRNPHYHQPTDTLETIDVEFLTHTAQQVMSALVTLLHSS